MKNESTEAQKRRKALFNVIVNWESNNKNLAAKNIHEAALRNVLVDDVRTEKDYAILIDSSSFTRT